MALIKRNNLDMLRLIFAMQVMVVHGLHHVLNKEIGWLDHIPGVPAFFFISGFLIYAAYANSPRNVLYFQNRVIRLLPGLMFVTLGGLVVVVIAKGFGFLSEHVWLIVTWSLSQITLGQAYNPDAFRDVGVGVINGSLWTITVEILFYLSVPVIVLMEKWWRHSVSFITLLSALIYVLFESGLVKLEFAGRGVEEYLKLTPVYWGWMFGLGILAFKKRNIIPLNGILASAAIVACVIMAKLNIMGPFFSSKGNQIGIFYYAPYVYLIYYFSFSIYLIRPARDLSYGIYVWHMPIVNLALVVGLPSSVVALGGVFLATIVMAFISWTFVERPALSMKKVSIRKG